MTKYDEFIRQQVAPRLQPGESIVATGFIFDKPLGRMLLGGALAMMGSGYFFAALTERRLLLVHTSMGFMSVKMASEGFTEIPYAAIASVQPGGTLNMKTVSITLTTGETRTYRVNTLARQTSGQGQFIDTLVRLHQSFRASGGAVPGVVPGVMPPPVPPRTAAPAPPPSPATTSVVEELKKLAELHQMGALTAEEYAATKAELLKRL